MGVRVGSILSLVAGDIVETMACPCATGPLGDCTAYRESALGHACLEGACRAEVDVGFCAGNSLVASDRAETKGEDGQHTHSAQGGVLDSTHCLQPLAMTDLIDQNVPILMVCNC